VLTNDLSPEKDVIHLKITLKLSKGELKLNSLIDVEGHTIKVDILESRVKVFNFHFFIM